tara:strand:- start:86 stop:373 length:288 start_codon:yes stop_codon:yes gene_type:complete
MINVLISTHWGITPQLGKLFPFFICLKENNMQKNLSESRQDRILLELNCIVNELQEFKPRLSIFDIDEAEKSLKKLQLLVREIKKSRNSSFQITI